MKELNTYTDSELVAMISEGNELAFREVYNRYNGLLYAYAFRRLQVKEEAKDVVQEVFISLWEKRSGFILKTYLSGFLYKSVLNKILDIWKHNKIVRKHVLSQPFQIAADSVETDFLIREKDVTAMIEREIAAMPARMREVYELRFKQHYSVKQIASEMEISENTVATQLQRASAHLKNKLGLVVFIMHLLNR
ncbi:sigma-70 family RNA polymerase sigma factor [Pedobacter sp. MC2016-14]|uniref:RNA polymerase sigma factor n=1 Tax=Pedobacter sp. MC2016-14 TaxID=2897327 RepID=UPI001E3BD068|nr:sigma-70 family RNA polymerase sigma factor [Pedobacter sp. MC2016-14]MCD0487783.1 sigma-70 family RNA polymerase sigma factor [Pedobacter sp. MC2016-14]